MKKNPKETVLAGGGGYFHNLLVNFATQYLWINEFLWIDFIVEHILKQWEIICIHIKMDEQVNW